MAGTTRNVIVKSPDGDLYEVPPGELSQLPEGSSIATTQEIEQRKAEKEYGGLGGAALAAVGGAASNLSLGASDVALRELGGPGAVKALRQAEMAHPYVTTAAEYGSFLLPGLGEIEALGAGAKAAKAASTGINAVSKVGEAAASVAKRALGKEAESAAGRIAQRAVTEGAQLGAESAIFGAGHAISEDALADKDLSAEHVLISAAENGLVGSILGGGIGTAIGGGKEAVRGIGSIVKERLGNKDVGEMLEKMARESIWHGVNRGGAKGLSNKAELRVEGGIHGLVGTWEENIGKWTKEATGTAKGFGHATDDELLAAAQKGMEDSGARMQSVLDRASAQAAEKGIELNPEEIVRAVRNVADRAQREAPGFGTAAKNIHKFADEMEVAFGLRTLEGELSPYEVASTTGKRAPFVAANDVASPVSRRTATAVAPGISELGERVAPTTTLDVLHKFRAMADKSAKWSKREFGFELFPKVRGELEDILQNKIEQASGKRARDEFIKAKKDYQAAKFLDDAVFGAKNRSVGNLTHTLTGKIMAGVGASVGHAFGPLGSVAGAVGGMAGAALARKYGDFAEAAVLRKMKGLAGIEVAESEVARKVADGVASFLRKGTGRAIAGFSKKDHDDTVRDIDSIRHLSANPVAMHDALDKTIGPMAEFAPQTATIAGAKMAARIHKLAELAPLGKKAGSLVQPAYSKSILREHEVRAYKQYVRAVKNPLSFLDDLKNGTLNRKGVDALEQFQPALLQQMREAAMDAVADLDKKLPYDKSLQLGILLGIPADATLQPEVIQKLQASAAPTAQGPKQAGQHQKTQRPLKLNIADYETASEQLGQSEA